MPAPPNFDPVRDSIYHYIPSGTVAIIMISLFTVSTLAHAGQAYHYKMWWLFPTAVLCGVMEVAGWSGRLWSHYEVWNDIPFQIQICCTIIAPTPLLAATFVIFGEVIRRLGTIYSRLTPKRYTMIFLSCDMVSLVIQGVGGGLAASAEEGESPDMGGNIMLGGIVLQLVAITMFLICAGEFMFRYIKERPVHTIHPSTLQGGDPEQTGRGVFTRKLQIVLSAMAFSLLALFIRAIYRTVELSDGWSGKIIATELYFNVLEGPMIILAIYMLNFVHPGYFVYGPRSKLGSLEKGYDNLAMLPRRDSNSADGHRI